MDDDWRLRIDLHDHGRAHRLLESLDSTQLEHRLESSFKDRVVVSRENSELFLYAGTREQVEAAAELARSFAQENGWDIETELRHWHPTAEDWEDPDNPLPSTEAEQAAEHAQMIEAERDEPEPDFEVRIVCDSRQTARELADQLRQEGLPNVRRSNYVLVGARDEDSANALAERLKAEAPPGSVVTAEGTARYVAESVGPNPFAIFGGLGG
jgi:predicted Zn-dependent protease